VTDERRSARAKRLLEQHAPELDALKLARPAVSSEPLPALAEPARKYPALQELAAQKRGVQDEFSSNQLAVLEVKAKLESDLAVLAGSAGAKPVAGPTAAAKISAPQEVKPAVSPAQAAPAVSRPPGPAIRAQQIKNLSLPASRWGRALAGAALGAALLLLLFYGKEEKASFSLPPSAAAGLCLDGSGSRAYFTDPHRQLLVTVSIAGRRVEGLQSLQASGLKALAYDGAAFWATDGTSIFRYPPGAPYPEAGAYKAGPGVFALSWDGRNLWAASVGGRLVRYAAGEKPAPEAVFQLPEGVGSWLAVYGGKLWELDAETGRLAAYTLGAKPEQLGSADARKYLPRGQVAGFAVNGGSAWVISAEPAGLARLDLKRLKLLQDGK
jgi:hypothetical protein